MLVQELQEHASVQYMWGAAQSHVLPNKILNRDQVPSQLLKQAGKVAERDFARTKNLGVIIPQGHFGVVKPWSYILIVADTIWCIILSHIPMWLWSMKVIIMVRSRKRSSFDTCSYSLQARTSTWTTSWRWRHAFHHTLRCINR